MSSQKISLVGTICNSNSKNECYDVNLELDGLNRSTLVVDTKEIAEFWGLAFASVLSLYLIGKGIGTLLDFIRNH